VWGERTGGYRLSIGVKATFALAHGEDARLAPKQDTAHGDISWDHNPQAALFAPSDYVPYKPRIDVAFSGRAFSPGGLPTDVLTPRLRVGHFEKSVRVLGPRVWLPSGGGLRASAPERFVAVPLRYEIAAMQGENLSGVQSVRGSAGWPLPRIEAIEDARHGLVTPGFGPLPIRWRAENRGASEDALVFARRLRSQHAEAPEELPFALFNCAPEEQQLDELEPAPVITLEHLTRRAPRFESRLPNIRPRAFYAHESGAKPFEVDLRLDTIWIDGMRLVAVVSWRGTTEVRAPHEHGLGRIVVASESPEMIVSLEDVESPPVPPEDSSPRPVLPRPFEGEIAEDEGYTLLPMAPVQHAPPSVADSKEAEEPGVRAPVATGGGIGAAPRDSSPQIPPSGERRIEDRASRFVVESALPGPNELTARAPDDPAAEEEAAPATARTGTTNPPPVGTRESEVVDGTEPAPATLVPSTRKTGTVPPPATLPTAVLSASSVHDRRMHELPPATQRAPALLTWPEPKGYLEVPDASAALFSSSSPSGKVEPSGPPAIVAVSTPRPTGERRRPSTTGMSAPTLLAAELPLEVFACVVARIERCPEERARILADMDLTEERWTSTEQTWASAIRTDLEQGRSDLRLCFDRAYMQQIECERGAIDVTEYAQLMVAVEHGDGDAVLAEFGMPRTCLVRLERVFQERMAADPSFGARARAELASARRAFAKGASSRQESVGATDPAAAFAEGTASTRPRSSDR